MPPPMNNKPVIKAGIIGAAGYTGGELIRLLIGHPYVDLVFAHSKSKGEKLKKTLLFGV